MARDDEQNNADWSARRKEVLLAAAKLFAERGFDSVSLREIGAASGLHMSTLYHYFPNKAKLWDDVCVWAFEYTSRLSLSMMEGDEDVVTRLKRYVFANVKFVAENGTAARILEQELLFRVSSSLLDSPTVMIAPVKRLAELLTVLAPPILKQLPAERLAMIVWDIMYGIARNTPANFRVMDLTTKNVDVGRTSTDVWLVLCELLRIDDPEATARPPSKPARRRVKAAPKVRA